MTHVERSIEVAVPVRTAYDQWTQFEDFPRFMAGVQEVRQIGDALTHWVAEIAGVKREWDAAILEQVPDQKVAWAATTGATNAGAVYFKSVGEGVTQVRLTLDYEPEGLVEKIGDFLDVVDRQAVADLDRFKEFIEKRGTATGGWRGEVDEGDVTSSGAGVGAAATGGRAAGTGVAGDVVAVGPTGDTQGTVATEAGSPVVVDAQSTSTRTGDTGTAGPTADAATSFSTGVVGFGTDTGLRSDDPASGVLTGNPEAATAGGGSRGGSDSSGTAGPTAGAATSSSTGVVGFGTDTGLSNDDPASGVVTGDPGASDAGVGASGLTAAPHAASGPGRDEEWGNEPAARSGTTEATTDPVGESWSADEGGAGVAGSSTGAADQRGGQRDFANREILDEGEVQRDFANREITNEDVANRGVTTGMGGARPNPTSARASMQGDTGFTGTGAGPSDDPEDPQRPSV